jgi:Mimiviridae putative ATP-dependent RNA helicase
MNRFEISDHIEINFSQIIQENEERIDQANDQANDQQIDQLANHPDQQLDHQIDQQMNQIEQEVQNNQEEEHIVIQPIKLLNYQVPHAEQMKEAIRSSKCVLDASDTGTGKTYVAISICKDMGYEPFIICPKSVIPNWKDVAKKFGVKIFGIANYELLKGCKYYTENYEKVECPYMFKINIPEPTGKDDKNGNPVFKKDANGNYLMMKSFRFDLPRNVMVIFDEAHRCKNHKTITSRMLRAMNKSPAKIMLLSATISDKVKCFKPFGEVFGFYNDVKKYNMWMRKAKKASTIYYSKKNYTGDQITLDIIHNRIFPAHGSRMRISELGDMFPKNQVCYQAYMCENKEEVQEQYDIIKEAFHDLKKKELRSEALGKLIRARMKVEMFKMPIMLDVIDEALDSGYSVAIFVNYIESMEYLAHYFETDCLIHGSQTLEERQDSIDQFQSNNSRIIIAIIQAGGVGISLHDIHGGHPRMSVISPTWSGQDMMQVLGRIHRAGSQSPALQRIIYCAETYEDEICKLIQNKMINITALNDQNFLGPTISEEEFKEVEEEIKEVNQATSESDIIDRINKIFEDTNTDIESDKIEDSDEDGKDSEEDSPQTETEIEVEISRKYTRILDKDKRKKFVKVRKA